MSRPRAATPRPAFTLVELLVVIVIIIIVAGVLLAALGGAFGTARRSAVESQLASIGQAVGAFEVDFEEPPPLITELEDGDGQIRTPGVVPGASLPTGGLPAYLRDHRYMSEFSLPIFLLGQGDLDGVDDADEDGDGVRDEDDGHNGFGLRDPGPSRAWKDATGAHSRPTSGRVYGPYMEPGAAERLIERVPVRYDTTPFGLSSPRIVEDATSDRSLVRFVDAFGAPIRFYRDWPRRHLGPASVAPNPADVRPGDRTATLAPAEIRSPETVRAQRDLAGSWEEDLGADPRLASASFALLSAGAPIETFGYDSGGGGYVNIPGFGDVVPDASGASVRLVQPEFDPAGFVDDTQERLFFEMLDTNVRYVP